MYLPMYACMYIREVVVYDKYGHWHLIWITNLAALQFVKKTSNSSCVLIPPEMISNTRVLNNCPQQHRSEYGVGVQFEGEFFRETRKYPLDYEAT